MSEKKKVFLTQEGYDEIKEELDNLINVKRPENIIAIKEARALGDLSENADYDAARNEQAEIEARIKKLEASHEGRLTIGIMDQKVHVLFYNDQNAMEPSLFNEITSDDFIKVENEMNQIIEVMDALNLIGKE